MLDDTTVARLSSHKWTEDKSIQRGDSFFVCPHHLNLSFHCFSSSTVPSLCFIMFLFYFDYPISFFFLSLFFFCLILFCSLISPYFHLNHSPLLTLPLLPRPLDLNNVRPRHFERTGRSHSVSPSVRWWNVTQEAGIESPVGMKWAPHHSDKHQPSFCVHLCVRMEGGHWLVSDMLVRKSILTVCVSFTCMYSGLIHPFPAMPATSPHLNSNCHSFLTR